MSEPPRQLGPYHLLEQLGAGGMGNVYLARHGETGEFAAIKILPPELAREEGFVLRFEREIEALRLLDNPHIVRFLESGRNADTVYFVMEYVPGENLAQRIRREHRLPWVTALELARQLCTALKAAHDAGVIHRDMKPSNVLLTKTGEAKLTDFGVAQVYAGERLTITGGVIGTAEYMAPEQAQGNRATKRSDLYSLGAVLYAMLAGRPPFTAPTAVEVMHKHRYGRFDLPSRYVPDLPHRVDDLVSALLAKNPDERPVDAFIVGRQIDEVLRTLRPRGPSDLTVSDQPVLDPTVAALPGPTTFMRELVRAEVLKSAEPTPLQRFFNNTFVLLTLLAGLVGVTWWFSTRRPPAAQRLARAQELLNSATNPDWQKARDEFLKPLLEEDRARWESVVQPLLEEAAVLELEDRLASPRRRGKRAGMDSELFWQLAEIRRLWDRGALAGAAERLDALQVAADDIPDGNTIRRLIQRWREQLTADLQTATGRTQAFAQTLLRRAAEQQDADHPERARALCQAVITLYGDDPTAETEVQSARERLRQFPAETSEPGLP